MESVYVVVGLPDVGQCEGHVWSVWSTRAAAEAEADRLRVVDGLGIEVREWRLNVPAL